MTKSEIVEAQFIENAPLAQAEPQPIKTAEYMLAQLKEWESFKSRAVADDAWINVPGVKGRYLPAHEVDRLAPAVGVRIEILSKNEHGDPGVRRAIVDTLLKGELVKTIIYSVTVRAWAGDRFVDVEGSFDMGEIRKSDYFSRAQALTRATRKATLRLLGGVEDEPYEESREQRKTASQQQAERPREVPSIQQLYAEWKDKAASLGLPDGHDISELTVLVFKEWVYGETGLEPPASNWKPSVDERKRIMEAIRS